jgi:hypothetical protein
MNVDACIQGGKPSSTRGKTGRHRTTAGMAALTVVWRGRTVGRTPPGPLPSGAGAVPPNPVARTNAGSSCTDGVRTL